MSLALRVGKPQGNLLGKGVWDCGKSEWLSVMGGIGVQNLPRRESVQTSTWYDRRYRLSEFIIVRRDTHIPSGFVRPRGLFSERTA